MSVAIPQLGRETRDGDSPAEVHDALDRVERWLLHSGIQIEQGPQLGGIAGWLDAEGNPEFVYLEIVGYYLTSMAWLSVTRSPGRLSPVHSRARRAADWLSDALSSGQAPPTRLYLGAQPDDWRNRRIFTFDLAMAARGIAVNRGAAGPRARHRTLAALSALIGRICAGAELMSSHESATDGGRPLPHRWSTRPGPHHLKASAALLRLPGHVVGPDLLALARRTCDHWEAALLGDEWPCHELHALLYGLEGMVIRDRAGALADVEPPFSRIMELQTVDGGLPETIHGGDVRSDVVAQALRIAQLLRDRGYLSGPAWTDRLDGLTTALLGFVRPDGGVRFRLNQEMSNAWCAMFAHQALWLRRREGARNDLPSAAFDLLV